MVDLASLPVGFQPVADLATVRVRVENLAQVRGLTMRALQERVGVTKTGWREMWQRESVRVKVLVRIAEALQVPVCALLATDAVGHVPHAADGAAVYLEQRVEHLEHALQQLLHDLRRKG